MAILTSATNLNSQTLLTENFSGNPFANGWTVIDADSDGMQWQVMNITGFNTGFDSQAGMALSSSLIPGSPGYTPDNMLLTPSVTLTLVNSSNNLKLSFKAGSDMSTASGNYEEHFSIYAVTGSTLPEILAATPVLSSTLTAGRTIITYNVDLTSLAGQSAKIVFRHHACTDESSLFIDDVLIEEVPQTAITLQCGGQQNLTFTENGTSLPNVTTTAQASTTCSGTVTLTQSPAAGTTMTNGVNNVTVTATDGCGNTETCTTVVNFSNNAGIAGISNNDFKIFPNPVENDLFIKSDLEIKSLQILSFEGKLIDLTFNKNNVIDVSKLNSGIYYLVVNENITYKFIK